MSTKETKAAPATTAPVKHEAPAGFVDVDLDLPSFKAELYTQQRLGQEVRDYVGGPVQGFILECRDFGDMTDKDGNIVTNEDGEVRRNRALVIQLEKPLMVQGRDKSQPAYEAKIGDKILFFPTFKIMQAILAIARPPAALAHLDMGAKVEIACNHPVKMLRIWVLPTTQTKHPTNPQFRIWNYNIKVDPVLHARSGAAALGGHLFDQVNVLPAAPVNGTKETVLGGLVSQSAR